MGTCILLFKKRLPNVQDVENPLIFCLRYLTRKDKEKCICNYLQVDAVNNSFYLNRHCKNKLAKRVTLIKDLSTACQIMKSILRVFILINAINDECISYCEF